MTTSAKQTSLFGTDESTSSQVDFLANHTAWQGSDKAQRMLDISGQKCAEQFESAGRPGLWARTFLGLLIGQEGWFSSRCALIWKVKGTKYNRLYCQLQVSTLRTGEIGSGLWDIETDLMGTPRAMERPRSEKFLQKDQGVKRVPTPSEYIGLLKTPTKMDGEVTNGIIPTPSTRDYKGARTSEALEAAGRNQTNSLPDYFAQTGQSSQLNPHFVLEMMGFPPDWTELPFLNGETNQ